MCWIIQVLNQQAHLPWESPGTKAPSTSIDSLLSFVGIVINILRCLWEFPQYVYCHPAIQFIFVSLSFSCVILIMKIRWACLWMNNCIFHWICNIGIFWACTFPCISTFWETWCNFYNPLMRSFYFSMELQRAEDLKILEQIMRYMVVVAFSVWNSWRQGHQTL